MWYTDPEITHCILGPELCKESLCGPVFILLKLEQEVVLYASYLDETPPGVTPITPFDPEGIRLVRVPVKYIAKWLTTKEAEFIDQTMTIEEMRVLAYG